MVSPYPWSYTLRWPLHWLAPSTRRRSAVAPLPRRATLVQGEPRPGGDASGGDVVLVFAGDVMCLPGDQLPSVHDRIRELLASADLVVANCEAPVVREAGTPSHVGLFRFEMSAGYLAALLERLGVRRDACVLSVANNHAGDAGPDGLAATVRVLRAMEITPVGARGADSAATTVVGVGGLEVGLFAWTEWLNADPFRPGEGPWRGEDVKAWPGEGGAAADRADLLMGLPHWDYEFRHFPDPGTRALAARVSRRGCHLLVGHHPHVLQPAERTGDGLCFYSLGNLTGPPSLRLSPYARLGGLLEVRVGLRGRRRGLPLAYRVRPVVQSGRGDDLRLLPLDRVRGPLRGKLERRLARILPPA